MSQRRRHSSTLREKLTYITFTTFISFHFIYYLQAQAIACSTNQGSIKQCCDPSVRPSVCLSVCLMLLAQKRCILGQYLGYYRTLIEIPVLEIEATGQSNCTTSGHRNRPKRQQSRRRRRFRTFTKWLQHRYAHRTDIDGANRFAA